jgi:hypothetical protein
VVGIVPARLARLGCLAAVLLAARSAADTSRHADEPSVKAELVERFCRFIEWPERALGAADRPFVIGILGDDEVAPQIESIAASRRIQGRAVEVRRLASPAGVFDCHLVWISRKWAGDLASVLSLTGGRPILTVADAHGAAKAGVLINLVRKGERVAFEVNADAAKASGLVLSSRLLRLATIVEQEGAP